MEIYLIVSDSAHFCECEDHCSCSGYEIHAAFTELPLAEAYIANTFSFYTIKEIKVDKPYDMDKAKGM